MVTGLSRCTGTEGRTRMFPPGVVCSGHASAVQLLGLKLLHLGDQVLRSAPLELRGLLQGGVAADGAQFVVLAVALAAQNLDQLALPVGGLHVYLLRHVVFVCWGRDDAVLIVPAGIARVGVGRHGLCSHGPRDPGPQLAASLGVNPRQSASIRALSGRWRPVNRNGRVTGLAQAGSAVPMYRPKAARRSDALSDAGSADMRWDQRTSRATHATRRRGNTGITGLEWAQRSRPEDDNDHQGIST